MFIDSHAHLFDQAFRPDLDAVIDRARAAGITAIIVPGTDLATSREAVELAERYSDLYACVGIHPHESAKAGDGDLDRIADLCRSPRVVAIGEIGLDYYYDFSPRDVQMRTFAAQMELAASVRKPVVIHTRESMTDALRLVRESAGQFPRWNPPAESGGQPRRGVFHCFPGTADEAAELRTLGFAVSYPGIVTFRNSRAMEILGTIGYEKILLETDAPYLAPVPLRGKRNEPAHLSHIARHIAGSLGITEEALAAATTLNSRRLFNLP